MGNQIVSEEIEAEALTTFEVTDDGSRIRFNGTAFDGAPVSFSLPTECMRQMVMTLPKVAIEALRRQHGDSSLRIVYPAGDWLIEQCPERHTFIVTLSTPDGFEASFGFGQSKMRALERSIRDANATVTAPPPILN